MFAHAAVRVNRFPSARLERRLVRLNFRRRSRCEFKTGTSSRRHGVLSCWLGRRRARTWLETNFGDIVSVRRSGQIIEVDEGESSPVWKQIHFLIAIARKIRL
jgi:hypothetical protein